MALSLDRPPSDCLTALRSIGARRVAFVARPEGGLRAYPESFQPLADELSGHRDFAAHEAVFLERGYQSGALMGAFVHDSTRGQVAGGVRNWPYETLGDYLVDGLRLAQGMGRKNALAGLWWGGGKGVIARETVLDAHDPAQRARVYQDYGRFISSLRGVYVTAEDAGTTAEDMAQVFRTTRHVTCVPAELGGSGNPSSATAAGVVCALEGVFDELGATLSGARLVLQGAGHVGRAMLGLLLEREVESVLVADIAPTHLARAREANSSERVSYREVGASDLELFDEPCDAWVPNALGGVLNENSIPRLKARIVCGAANNQLLEPDLDDQRLAARGITYVPDFVANRMGIVQCANEQYGVMPDDPVVARHLGRGWENSVYRVTRKVIVRARQEGLTTARAAEVLADEAMTEDHPIWPGRGRNLIASLVGDEWHLGRSETQGGSDIAPQKRNGTP